MLNNEQTAFVSDSLDRLEIDLRNGSISLVVANLLSLRDFVLKANLSIVEGLFQFLSRSINDQGCRIALLQLLPEFKDFVFPGPAAQNESGP